MGARPGRSPGDLVSCGGLRRLLTFVLLLCACLLMAMAATEGASFGSNNAAAGSPAQRPGGADAFRSSKRRIPKGPDPIHNRYCLSTDGCMHAVVVLVCLHFGIFSTSTLDKLQFCSSSSSLVHAFGKILTASIMVQIYILKIEDLLVFKVILGALLKIVEAYNENMNMGISMHSQRKKSLQFAKKMK